MKAIYLIFALALFLPEECRDDHDGGDTGTSDPAQLIMGQWQEIARGNATYPELEPDGHIIEFLPDGTLPGGTYHSHLGVSNPIDIYRIDINHWKDGEELRTTRGEFEKVFHKIN
jgi:hypothetical protein